MDVTSIVQTVWAASALFLIILVILHSPKGDGIGGIGGQAQLFTSAKTAETTLNRITWLLSVIFMSLSVILAAGWLGTPNIEAAPSAPLIEQTVPGGQSIPTDLPGTPESIPAE
ncbi:preprotein translocase subunit SecG [Spirulina sp. CCNP1310]|nr:preprotein translocase subunit SecG [Spirulina sp. CCNP1310]MEA5418375.1 preprotein translocase subunit SecG [Spirulina sp. CCNP1310]